MARASRTDLGPAPEAPDPISTPIRRREWRRWFADPATTFLVVGLSVGVLLACVVPHFGGIDENAHFYRAYQVSTGRLVPLHPAGSEFSGACVPTDLVRGVLRDGRVVFFHNAGLADIPPGRVHPPRLQDVPRCADDPSQRFVTFSTFGSPVPYLPQAVGIFVARELGVGADGMGVASRLAALLAYVAIVWFAIRRATRSRWALCATALIPVALYQASASESHDALTIALALLVVSSALRLVDAGAETQLRRAAGEALVLTALLAACKPGYVVLSACYLLPLLGRSRRSEWWPLAVVPVVGVVVSLLWNEAVGSLWRTDADLFGVAVDPGRQRSLLLQAPWNFVGVVARTLADEVWEWGKGLVTLGPSVAVWPAVAVGATLGVLALVSVQRSAREPRGLDGLQRGLLVVIFVVGCLLVLGAQYVYWSVPGADVVGGMQARFFVPLVVLVPIVIGPRRGSWAGAATQRLPLAVLLVPIYVALLVTISYRMY